MSPLQTGERYSRITSVLADIGPAVIACSGGIDSTLLALVAHRVGPGTVRVVHAISPAVPEEATARVRHLAVKENWALETVSSGEFVDERYLSNPVDRCYFCKSNLYSALIPIADKMAGGGVILSGANCDDLGEYRPGLLAASERGVRHPWIEADFAKDDIRALARELNLAFSELPASPCLASRLYTGTRVTPSRLRAVHACENLIRTETGIAVVRCRIRDTAMLVEVSAEDRTKIDRDLLTALATLARSIDASIDTVRLDEEAYRPGRAFVAAS